ncbi:gp16 family protein [Shewanella sp. NIFS-20-20]|uniref:gp16 family protein n=1 Tax=Shewanella sp. NIFS-20-20 TaxID=2853806 RepID=UPI001C437F57|nr:regulatory protein GemA [Shewanella sp. NIFS-20-20]MBV7315470.1 regulatory protein GemA [Shewanella sp. NIFS-20-20]
MSNALKLVQIGKRDLQLDDDMYRNLLEQVTGQRSAKGLSDSQLNDVVALMKKRGFKPKKKPVARAAEVAKIRAIWLTMFDQDFVRSKTDVSINTYVKRMTKTSNGQGVERIEWLKPAQAAMVLEALKKWHYRCMADAIIAKGGKVPANDKLTGPAGYDKLAAYYNEHFST